MQLNCAFPNNWRLFSALFGAVSVRTNDQLATGLYCIRQTLEGVYEAVQAVAA
jgi:hypothetical protein